MATITFPATSFVVSTKINKDAPAKNTAVSLTSGPVEMSALMDTLTSGNSPRVRAQNVWRDNGIPDKVEMSWSDWIVGQKRTTVTVQETPDQIAARALANPELLAQLLKALGK